MQFVRQINTTRQSSTQHLFYIQWYICQGDMFRPSRSSSGCPRKQIQELLIFLRCGIPNAYMFQLQELKTLLFSSCKHVSMQKN